MVKWPAEGPGLLWALAYKWLSGEPVWQKDLYDLLEAKALYSLDVS